MSTATVVGEGQTRFSSCNIENSILFKGIACIPAIGAVFSFCIDLFLSKKIVESKDDVPRVIALIKVAQEYQTINVGRSLVSMALIVTGIALGIITNPYAGVILYFGHVFLTIYHSVQIIDLNKSLKAISR